MPVHDPVRRRREARASLGGRLGRLKTGPKAGGGPASAPREVDELANGAPTSRGSFLWTRPAQATTRSGTRTLPFAADRNSPVKARVAEARIVLPTAPDLGTVGIMRLTVKSKTCVWRWPPPP